MAAFCAALVIAVGTVAMAGQTAAVVCEASVLERRRDILVAAEEERARGEALRQLDHRFVVSQVPVERVRIVVRFGRCEIDHKQRCASIQLSVTTRRRCFFGFVWYAL